MLRYPNYGKHLIFSISFDKSSYTIHLIYKYNYDIIDNKKILFFVWAKIKREANNKNWGAGQLTTKTLLKGHCGRGIICQYTRIELH